MFVPRKYGPRCAIVLKCEALLVIIHCTVNFHSGVRPVYSSKWLCMALKHMHASCRDILLKEEHKKNSSACCVACFFGVLLVPSSESAGH